MDINKILKILFVLSATVFLITLVSVPSSNCDACEIEYNGEIIDGYDAFIVFEEGCISYEKPGGYEGPINFTIE